jgi:rRNA maturation RNase YbeY
MAVTFFAEDVKMPGIGKLRVKRWLRSVVDGYGKAPGAITYIFCTDEKILAINKGFLKHDYYTDIITFDYSEGDEVSGDLFISLDTVRSNSEKFGTDFMEELHRVMVHGVLHLCGLGDKSEVEEARMREAENAALQAYNMNFK